MPSDRSLEQFDGSVQPFGVVEGIKADELRPFVSWRQIVSGKGIDMTATHGSSRPIRW
jgi:hypothetical protein